MEYLYHDCFTKTEEYCSFCSHKEWTSPLPMKRVPQPIPDSEKLYHFKPVNETTTTSDNGQPRTPDDFQPRANIKKLVNSGGLSSTEEIELFSMKFAVEPDLIKAYIAHLQDLKIQSSIRARGRVEQKSNRILKEVGEYAWLDLVQSGSIKITTRFGIGQISKTS